MSSDRIMFIGMVNNSFGCGYSIRVGYGFECCYYGYSLREAISKHRKNFNYQRKHLTVVKGW